MGSQISWLLPAALISAVLLIWVSRRGARTDRLRTAALLWGGWLLVTGAVFSLMAGIIHPYYTVALAPAIAALAGIGAVTAWQARRSWLGRGTLAAITAVTAAWSWTLLSRTPGWHPWLRVAVLLTGIVAAALLLAGPRLMTLAATGPGRRRLAALPVVLALTASLAGPVAYSLETAATAHTGALPSAGPAVVSAGGPGAGFPGAGAGIGRAGRPGGGLPGGHGLPGAGTGAGAGTGTARPGVAGSASGRAGRAAGHGASGSGAPSGQGTTARVAGGGPGGAGGGLGGATQVSSALTDLLKNTAGYRWAAATVGSESAAPLQLASRRPVMAIGGFNGTDPAPSLAEFERLVAARDIRYLIGANQDSFGGGSGAATQIATWVKDHFRTRTVGGLTVYDLTRPTQAGAS